MREPTQGEHEKEEPDGRDRAEAGGEGVTEEPGGNLGYVTVEPGQHERPDIEKPERQGWTKASWINKVSGVMLQR